MNPAKKIAAGAAIVVVAAATGLPAITGYLLENSIKEQLEGTAAQHNYSVSSVSVNRSFAETTVDVVLEGDNLRQLSRESLQIKGSLKHSHVFSLPMLASGDFDYTYFTYQEGNRTALPGTVKGSVDWHGNIQAELTAEGMELPLDASTTLTIHPASAAMGISGDYGKRMIQLDLDTLGWDIWEQGELLGAVSLKPSKLAYSNESRNWNLEIPSASFNVSGNDDAAPFSISDIRLVGHQYSENGLIQSNIDLETGAFVIPELEHLNDGKLIEGLKMTSSVENVSQGSISYLAELLQELNQSGDDQQIVGLATNFLVELSQNNPRFALDDFTIKTANGDISLAFNIAGSEVISTLFAELAELEYLTHEQEDEFLLRLAEGLNSSAKLTLSEEMLDWGCDRMGEQVAFEKGASELQARMVGSMCKTLAKSGDFLNLACLQAPNPLYQYQCSSTVDQAKKVWVTDRSLELTLAEGRLMFNGVALELPVL